MIQFMTENRPWVPSKHCNKCCLNFRTRLHSTFNENSRMWGLPTSVPRGLPATIWRAFSLTFTLRPAEFQNKPNLAVPESAASFCAHDANLQALSCGGQSGSVLRKHIDFTPDVNAHQFVPQRGQVEG